MAETVVRYGNGVQTVFPVPGHTSRTVYVGGVLKTPSSFTDSSITLPVAPGVNVPVEIEYEVDQKRDRSVNQIAIPTPPISFIATAQNGRARLDWAWNDSIPDYIRIVASPGNLVLVVPTNSFVGTADFTGLTNGVTYTFTAQAGEEDGITFGKRSTASNAVTPTALPSTILPVTRGLEFWWSAGQATSPGNGNPLTSLQDFSGNGYNFAAQNGGGTWVAAWSGGRPAVALNGTSQYYHALVTKYMAGMRGPNATIYIVHDTQAQPATVGYVLSALRPNVLSGILSVGFGVGVKLGSASNATECVFDNIQDFVSGATRTGPNIPWGTPTRVTVTSPGGLRSQGAAVAGLVGPRVYMGEGNQPWTVGAMFGGGFNYYLQGRIAEIVIFSEVHTPAEIALMETYLSTRF